MKNVFNIIISFIKSHVAIVVAAAVAVTAAGIGIGIAVRNRQQTQEPPAPTKHEHSYTSEVIPSTCGHGGYTLHACECGDSYRTDETDPLPHEYGEWVITIKATVDNEGQQEKHCLHCNDRIIEVIPQLKAHEHVYEDEIVDPTCIKKGYTLHTCTVCGHTTSDAEKDALGHSWSSWKETKAATVTETGEKTRSCKACGEAESVTIPKLIKPHTHEYTETVVAPTCTESGYILHTCECGDTYTSNETSKSGHLYGSWETTKKPTSTETGERQCVCSRCGDVKIESIDKLTTEQDNAYTSYIDPRIEIRTYGSGGTRYHYELVSVVDWRSWGSPPTIRITDSGGFDIIYFKQDGTKVCCSLNPVEGYINRLSILEDGSYTTRLIGDYND